jgi:hypothetical protein
MRKLYSVLTNPSKKPNAIHEAGNCASLWRRDWVRSRWQSRGVRIITARQARALVKQGWWFCKRCSPMK